MRMRSIIHRGKVHKVQKNYLTNIIITNEKHAQPKEMYALVFLVYMCLYVKITIILT